MTARYQEQQPQSAAAAAGINDSSRMRWGHRFLRGRGDTGREEKTGQSVSQCYVYTRRRVPSCRLQSVKTISQPRRRRWCHEENSAKTETSSLSGLATAVLKLPGVGEVNPISSVKFQPPRGGGGGGRRNLLSYWQWMVCFLIITRPPSTTMHPCTILTAFNYKKLNLALNSLQNRGVARNLFWGYKFFWEV